MHTAHSTQLLWLRNDLRTQDNTALNAALQAGPTIAIVLISPLQWQTHHDAACKVDFWLRNLAELQQRLSTLNVPLVIRSSELWQKAPAIIAKVCQKFNIQAVHVNTEYGFNEAHRDQSVSTTLANQNVLFHSHLDQLLFKPGSILTQNGTYFKVFSQFKKACYKSLYDHLPACLDTPHPQSPLTINNDVIPQHIDGFTAVDAGLQALWPAGETVALQRLAAFNNNAITDYAKQRDFPALHSTSQLSPYLVSGTLSIRQCLHAALAINQGEFESGQSGVITWINELLWREFYHHVLVGYPKVSCSRAFKAQTEAIPWRDAPADLLAWQQGQTGFPIIDAAMRQLLATGWMHNRLRMIVAMFLTKNLLIDWRKGERFFMQHLIDGNLAANNGGWQWSASSGTDAAPYFRIFNPISQSKRFDPNGDFIRHWLPELKHLSAKAIHYPQLENISLASTISYPKPIVDLSTSRARAIDVFKSLPPILTE
ncbi:deoxyribodipyrimidine photo-lyase [Denitrificimonas sp. JX-1]|uniref:Deoxyribodipyrimidine photo-lyase n=1 Tax=Denitrificimonas halotolerans TaxID=3098930 RepID=A0ABU5GV00_9GAMM|nr:deoxyribodipyrimidine photo-lyase [Denitrificimonas sp. JX-1]MDY7220482.1 deoxyribodipyrimidine photo-lyase [Denitrificimonas sp. JX-1]